MWSKPGELTCEEASGDPEAGSQGPHARPNLGCRHPAEMPGEAPLSTSPGHRCLCPGLRVHVWTVRVSGVTALTQGWLCRRGWVWPQTQHCATSPGAAVVSQQGV